MHPHQQQQPQMPQDTWPITRDDKVEIQDLGRKIEAFLRDYFKDRDQVHIKTVVGAFNYVMDLQTQRTRLIADDFIVAKNAVTAAKFDDRIEEPFTPEPEVPEPTVEEQIAAKEAEIEALKAQQEVDNASPSPTEGAEPMEGPSNEAPSVPAEGAQLAAAPVAPAAAPTEPAPAAPVAPVEAPAAITDKPTQG